MTSSAQALLEPSSTLKVDSNLSLKVNTQNHKHRKENFQSYLHVSAAFVYRWRVFLGGIQIKAHIKWFPPHRQDNFYLFNPGTCAGNFSSAETFVHILCSCFRTEDEMMNCARDCQQTRVFSELSWIYFYGNLCINGKFIFLQAPYRKGWNILSSILKMV